MRFEPRHEKPGTGTPRARHLRLVGAVCAVVASAALVTGCGEDSDKTTSAAATSEAAKTVPKQDATPSKSPSGSASLTQDQKERKALLAATKVTYDKASATAVEKVPDSKLTDLDLEGLDDDSDDGDDRDDASGSPSPSPSGSSGTPQWVAEVAEKDGTVHTVRIDAVSGKVISSAPDSDQDADDKKETADWIARAEQTPEQAAKVATDKKKGTVTSIGLDDNDSNALIWSVDVVTDDWNKTDFEIDAVKGTVTREDVDRD